MGAQWVASRSRTTWALGTHSAGGSASDGTRKRSFIPQTTITGSVMGTGLGAPPKSDAAHLGPVVRDGRLGGARGAERVDASVDLFARDPVTEERGADEARSRRP